MSSYELAEFGRQDRVVMLDFHSVGQISDDSLKFSRGCTKVEAFGRSRR